MKYGNYAESERPCHSDSEAMCGLAREVLSMNGFTQFPSRGIKTLHTAANEAAINREANKKVLRFYYASVVLLVSEGTKLDWWSHASWLISKELAERGGFEPPVQVLARTTV